MKTSPNQSSALSTSIRHLKVFERVAQLHGMQRATELCGLSQPAVTQAISNLEQEFGVALLERRSGGCDVNEYGALLLKRIQRMFAQIERALRDLKVKGGHASIGDVASDITRSQVRTLIGFVENGSFSKAARALNISSSIVQRGTRQLEKLLRTPLCIKTESGFSATPAAAEFARKLKLALHEIELALQEIETARGKKDGDIVIGAMPLTGSMALKSVIGEVVCEYPHANIRVMCESAEEMLDHVQRGDVDFVIGLLRQPTPNALVSKKIARTPYLIVARRGHPLTKKRNVTVDDLAEYEWIIGTPGANRRACFDKLFARHGLPKARIATYSLPMMKVLLAQSDCLTLLTAYEFFHDDIELASVPFHTVGHVPCLGVTMRKDWLPTRLQAGVLELISKRVASSMLQTTLASSDKR